MTRLAVLALLPLGLAAGAAGAQDFYVYGGAALQYEAGPDTDSKSDINGYVEVEKSGIYAGVWAEVSSQEVADEVDLYFGYRGEAGALSYDVGYTRYLYPNDGGDCCGEIGVKLSSAVSDALTLGAELYADPVNSTGSGYLTFEMTATDVISVSGQVGRYDDGYSVEDEWDIGVGYALGEETALDLRYYNGTGYEGYFGLELSWDTTILSR